MPWYPCDTGTCADVASGAWAIMASEVAGTWAARVVLADSWTMDAWLWWCERVCVRVLTAREFGRASYTNTLPCVLPPPRAAWCVVAAGAVVFKPREAADTTDRSPSGSEATLRSISARRALQCAMTAK